MSRNQDPTLSTGYYYNDVSILKAIAILFITWFHFKWSVPKSLSPLFIGGAIGNSIFFFCSGYLLSFKEEKYPGQWLLKKYIRIIPSVWGALCIMIVCTLIRSGIFQGYPLIEWFYPKQFWFVRAILIYFIVTYIAYLIYSRNQNNRKIDKGWLIAMMSITVIIHVMFYLLFVNKTRIIMDDNGIYCWFYWYAFFLLGYYVRNFGGKIIRSRFAIIECILSISLFFIYKTFGSHYDILIYLQFILIPIFLLYIVHAFRKLANYVFFLRLPKQVKLFFVFLSEITLEMYVVQLYFIKWIMPSTIFPVNLALSFAVILVVAYINHVIAGAISAVRKYL